LRILLADLGHDVRPVFDVDPRASDEAILALALQDERVLVTEDKDFGELVFVHRLPHPVSPTCPSLVTSPVDAVESLVFNLN